MLNQDFKEFAAFALDRVEDLVVGGYALAAYGHPRYTGDLDFWIGPDPTNAQRTLVALEQFGFGDLDIALDESGGPGRSAPRRKLIEFRLTLALSRLRPQGPSRGHPLLRTPRRPRPAP